MDAHAATTAMKKLINTKRVCAAALALAMALALVIPSLSMPASAANPQRFTDVAPDAWYAEAVNAMADAGIINGYGDGSFKPNNPMTAGELATVLWNMTYGKICKATELYNTFNNGYQYQDYTKPGYSGPSYGNWGIPMGYAAYGGATRYELKPTTWDGAVSLAIYGDARQNPNSAYMPLKSADTTQLVYAGRYAGRLYGNGECTREGDSPITYARDMSGLTVVAMSKDYITRGFAISELVNVLRETGHLESMYNANKNGLYTNGWAIPDWQAITNPYQDICSASQKRYPYNDYDAMYHFHDYTWAWNYIDEPGKVCVNGGYAATWFSADILLAYQMGLINGVDSTGRCNVNAHMTRAEVCQMLYNAGAGKTDLTSKYKPIGFDSCLCFIRDGKAYIAGSGWAQAELVTWINQAVYDSNANMSPYRNCDGTDRVIYSQADGIDIRQQEWPTHPEFWG